MARMPERTLRRPWCVPAAAAAAALDSMGQPPARPDRQGSPGCRLMRVCSAATAGAAAADTQNLPGPCHIASCRPVCLSMLVLLCSVVCRARLSASCQALTRSEAGSSKPRTQQPHQRQRCLVVWHQHFFGFCRTPGAAQAFGTGRQRLQSTAGGQCVVCADVFFWHDPHLHTSSAQSGCGWCGACMTQFFCAHAGVGCRSAREKI